MSVRHIKITPQAVFRANMSHFMHEVDYELNHVVLTRHRKPRAVIIPIRDARPLWHLQRRELSRIDHYIEHCYPAWVEAKRMTGTEKAMDVDGPHYLVWGGFGGM